MRGKHALAILFAVVVLLGVVPAATAQPSQVSAELLGNGTLLIEGSPGDDLIFVEAAPPNSVEVEAALGATWTFAADQIAAIKVETFDGDDRVLMRSELSSWTLTGVNIDLGEGIYEGAQLGVTSHSGTDTSLMITGSVKSRGGGFKLFAGSETGSSLLTVEGDLIEIGGPGDDSLGIETEFPGGTVLVKGDMKVIAGEGGDYIEFNANGTITVDGRYTVFGQTGEDYVWLGGQTGATVNGQTRLFGGPGDDELDLYNFTYDTISIKQFETCTDCP